MILKKSLTRLTAATEGISDFTEGGTCLLHMKEYINNVLSKIITNFIQNPKAIWNWKAGAGRQVTSSTPSRYLLPHRKLPRAEPLKLRSK